jgi:equilibrative nucleoside transporter 1/2/3
MIKLHILLTTLLTISTIVPAPPDTFFKCALMLTIFAGAIAAYLQCSVSAMASLFGPPALQASLNGQSALAVAMSTVQLVDTAISLSSGAGAPPFTTTATQPPEESSAFAFFALATCFLSVSFFALGLLVRTPAYQNVVSPLERKALSCTKRTGERQILLPSPLVLQGVRSTRIEQEAPVTRIMRVARANIVYELAVAYVYLITIVSSTRS